ncbi:Quinone oxidoreductase-like protein [Ananas comosus]|uniref:Quinone oxidoreductase-like protein n=1 Tax=Ananas comosus TaxID=4615 RepID=A0A199V2X5_ANACO|nr:Quinone oxidoreductase-like protein [Ananas comosus]
MEALLCHKLGDPALPTSDPSSPIAVSASHPLPALASPTSVRVRVRATSLNYANYLQILGKYQEKPPLPFIPGLRLLRRRRRRRRRRVLVQGRFLVPEGCDLVAAGALPVAFGTSHVALVHRAQLKSGQVLLVLGAAGGVGLSAVQIGKVCGAVIIAVARGLEKVQFLQSLGVDHVVDSSKENIIESVRNFLKTRRLKGVDVLYDPVGGKLMKDSMKLLNWGANILVIGFASGEIPVIPANIALVKNWTIHGLYWGSYKIHRPYVLNDSLKELLSWLSKGLISIQISHAYRLSEANLAFSALKDRKALGKVMIVMENSSMRSKL